MHPVDDVVADVEGMHVLRTHLHPEGVAVARGLEGLVPPARAIEERAANGLGRAGIEVVDDGLHRIGDLRFRIDLGQAMAAEEALLERRPEGGGAVLEIRAEETGARIEVAGLVAGAREFDEGVMDTQARRFPGGRDVAYALEEVAAAEVLAGAGSGAALGRTRLLLLGVGEFDLEFGVLGEVEGPRHVDGTARLIEAIRPGPQARSEVQVVADQERCRVDQHPARRLGRDRESPKHRPREGILHRLLLRRVVGRRAEVVVRGHEQDLRPHPLEHHDARTRKRAPIDPDVVRAEAGGDAGGMQDLHPEVRDLEIELPVRFIPVDGNEAVELLHVRGLLLDRGRLARGRTRGLSGRGRRDHEGEAKGKSAERGQ